MINLLLLAISQYSIKSTFTLSTSNHILVDTGGEGTICLELMPAICFFGKMRTTTTPAYLFVL